MTQQDKSAVDEFCRYMTALNDGTMDVERFIATQSGKILLQRLIDRTHIQFDINIAKEYYKSLGLEFEYNFSEDYYRRWKLFYPVKLEKGTKYPILFWLHGGGNSIEAEENMTGYLQLAGKEKFFLVLLQNTNEDNVISVYENVASRYPIDSECVYMAGFSQGSQQVIQCMTHHPDLVTAIAVTGTDIWRPWDNFDNEYTPNQLERLKELVVPMSLQVNQCEPFAYSPLNFWHPNNFNKVPQEERGVPDTFSHPGKIQDNDPTRITEVGKGRYEPNNSGKSRMASKYVPREEEDVSIWALGCVNKRLELLQCPLLDVSKCADYLCDIQDEMHHATGIYGDREEIRIIDEVKHYIIEIDNNNKIPAFRYVLTENMCHWPAPSAGNLGWNFMKYFRRDVKSKRIILKK
jgi:pimeloyl-ACP methyl ester carboxylesterase